MTHHTSYMLIMVDNNMMFTFIFHYNNLVTNYILFIYSHHGRHNISETKTISLSNTIYANDNDLEDIIVTLKQLLVLKTMWRHCFGGLQED